MKSPSITTPGRIRTEGEQRVEVLPEKIRYCLYARKSTESEERQVLSIDSQIKEMLQLAEREGIDVVSMRRESHSAKSTGERSVYNELLEDIRAKKFNGILTWAPDRLSRNAGDLGALVDLMDQGLLHQIRTFGQTFSNNPNEKFLLMILGSQAKLENDNRGINVKRGLRARVEMGLWPGMAPIGYLDQKLMDQKGHKILDPDRAPIVKQIFEKVAYEKWSGRKIYHWLRYELNFKTRGNKTLALASVFRMLNNPFYYGSYEFPLGTGNWYQGRHEPIITKELFDLARVQIHRDQIVKSNKEFAFTKLFICGLCQSSICAEEKYKQLKDGTHARYVYYGCSRGKDRLCKNTYIREDDLISQLIQLIDALEINDLGMQNKLEDEIKRFSKFQRVVYGNATPDQSDETDINMRAYAKYLLREGSITERRELLGNLRSRLVSTNGKITLLEN